MLNFPKNRSISSIAKSGMPQMDTTLYNWEVPLTLVKVVQIVVEGDLVTTETQINFKGVWQPLSAEQLNLLPEGQRSWENVWVHCKASQLNLETASKVIFNGKRYKITQKKDYGLNSYVEYMLIRDYEETETISDTDN
jgi:hypothetical protein